MKHGLVMVMSTMVVLTASANAQAQGQGRGGAPACTTVQCDVLGDWGRGYALLIGVAEAMPEDKFGFKPTPAQESFAQRLMHVAGIDLKLVSTLGGKTPTADGQRQGDLKGRRRRGYAAGQRLRGRGAEGVQRSAARRARRFDAVHRPDREPAARDLLLDDPQPGHLRPARCLSAA